MCAVGAVLNMMMMMSANLVGFVIGTEGVVHIAKEIVGTWSGECPPSHFNIRTFPLVACALNRFIGT